MVWNQTSAVINHKYEGHHKHRAARGSDSTLANPALGRQVPINSGFEN